MKIIAAGLLMLLTFALAVPTLAQTKAKPEKKDDRIVTASPVIEGDPMIPEDRISIQELKAKLDAKADVLILDVRANEGWNSSTTKIKGAIRVAMEEVEKKMSGWKKTQEIIAYCS